MGRLQKVEATSPSVCAVIPGRIEDANPESIDPQECWEIWIPGSRSRAPRN